MTWERSKFKIGRFFIIQNIGTDKQAKASILRPAYQPQDFRKGFLRGAWSGVGGQKREW